MSSYVPTAIVLSKRETHDNVPGCSSTTGLPLLELGLDGDVDVAAALPALKCIMRTDGRLYNISIWGSGADPALALCAGRLKERFMTGVVGAEAIVSFFRRIGPLYCLMTMIIRC